jgi:hypothetical protein
MRPQQIEKVIPVKPVGRLDSQQLDQLHRRRSAPVLIDYGLSGAEGLEASQNLDTHRWVLRLCLR